MEILLWIFTVHLRKSATLAPALTLCTFGLWMLFVVDYWNHSIAYMTFFPFHRNEPIRYSNAPYLISAGLPLVVFFLLSVLPDAMGWIFPKYRAWNTWHIAVCSILLTAQTALMLASTQFYVKTGIADLLFGYHYHQTLRNMTEYYVLSVPVIFGLSMLVWLTGMTASMPRMKTAVRRLTYRQATETALWCVALAMIHSVGSILILNLLFAMNFRSTVAYVTSFATQNASNFNLAIGSLFSAPIVEEIAFRGIICKGLKKYSNSWIVILISSVFFGLWHRNLGQFAYTFVFGILLVFVSLRSGSVIWPMLIHFLSNLVAILAFSNNSASVFGAWPAVVSIRVRMQEWPVWASILGLVVMVIMALIICRRIKK